MQHPCPIGELFNEQDDSLTDLEHRATDPLRLQDPPARRTVAPLFVLLAATAAAALVAGTHAASSAVPQLRFEFDVRVPMRDGVALSTDIYRPQGPGPFPVIVIRTPYDNNAEANVQDAVYFAERGYAVVLQDCRGRYDSDGEFVPLKNEGHDGFDTIEWAAAQPWSTGKVGTYGASYLGIDQLYAATLRPPHLQAMFPIVAYSDFYHNWIYTGGAFLLAYDLRWAISMGTRTRQNQYLWFNTPNHITDLYWHLPLITADEAAGRRVPFYREWLEHPTYDEFWKALSLRDKYDRITVPVYLWQGWYDVFLPGALDNFAGLRAQGRTDVKLLIGPWVHQARGRFVGDLDFGPAADLDRRPVAARWFDHWLKGADTGIMREAPVRIFTMGSNEWRDEWEWPPARTAPVRWYLHSSGRANSMFGDGVLSPEPPSSPEPADRFVYDPRDPVPTLGGATCCGENTTPVPMGPRDQRVSSRRDDVLVYTSAELTSDLEITGPVTARLYAASSAPDTDFTVKLIDVHPSGRAINIADGLLRARYRTSFEKPELMKPGTPYEFTIDLVATSNVFRAGHRLRVEISSSNFPRFDRNPNTGAPVGRSADLATAAQTIFHDAGRPSHLVFSVASKPVSSAHAASSARTPGSEERQESHSRTPRSARRSR